jgi:hypothetical protein
LPVKKRVISCPTEEKQHGEETYKVCGRSIPEGGFSKSLGASLPAITPELLIAPRRTLLLVSSSSTKGT